MGLCFRPLEFMDANCLEALPVDLECGKHRGSVNDLPYRLTGSARD